MRMDFLISRRLCIGRGYCWFCRWCCWCCCKCLCGHRLLPLGLAVVAHVAALNFFVAVSAAAAAGGAGHRRRRRRGRRRRHRR